MGPAEVAELVAAIMGGIATLSAAAPDVAKALTGGQTPEEAAAAAQAELDKISTLEAGSTGTWDGDLEERKKRG